ncbi:tRNA pseudouridine(55) synthase TruB [Robbsia sp. Bb-Pol-6]|uniref:tRNA pseudouridine synthase B n=2 Tax=Robbsia betulipollinis TaxID=2981849 RepID=A0ABT3ZIS2_9BURK|nr:tRNA pseudouridine(55) synthase TruB [Robbsia betulipollinis]MCY0386410.1 tRNA pseudouridine(55) synthase TruB [Robbsia betulipollinis]
MENTTPPTGEDRSDDEDRAATRAPRGARNGLRSRVARAARPPRRVLDGVLLLDKPIGLSSHDALLRVKGMLRAKKAGHTGTLDPLASGLLPLCFGEATKFSQDLLDADKYYEATLRLGERSDTGDAEGAIVETRPVTCDLAAVDAVIARFRGDIEQVPPMYSAIKRDGKPLYEYARAGQTVERDARRVTIHALERLSDAAELAGAQEVRVRVHCSKGTYIRTLAEDMGEALGCGAHLRALRRTRVGALTLDQAVTLQALQDRLEGDGRAMLPDVAAGRAADAANTADAADAADELHGARGPEMAGGRVDEPSGDPALAPAAPGETAGFVPALDPGGLLQPIDALLSSYPAVLLSAELAVRFRHGQRLRLDAHAPMRWPSPSGAADGGIANPAASAALDPATEDIGRVRVYGANDRLLGTATLVAGRLAPERLVGTDGA